jgi:hypothetical protein
LIVSASYRTDIPAFYSDWFDNRLDAGFVEVKNPYSRKLSLVSLLPEDVDGYVFWTRNPRPFLGNLTRIAKSETPFYIQLTTTGYPSFLEPSVPCLEQLKPALETLAADYGDDSLVWRYDPVFISSLTPVDWHLENFANLASYFHKLTNEVCISFTQIYQKTTKNSNVAANKHNFTWSDPTDEEKMHLLSELARIALENGLTPTICSQPQFETPSLRPAKCIDGERLGRISGASLNVKRRGNRPGCLCAESRDIGTYDSCPHGCCYCYANRTPEIAKKFLKEHNPQGSLL